MITAGEKRITQQMRAAMTDMALYDGLYQDFRRIRHDFANYVQSSRFESEDEDFILRLRMLKKQTLKLVDALLERIDKLPLEQLEDPAQRYTYLAPGQVPKKQKGREYVLYLLWEEMKEYYILQLKELPSLIPILLSLQDRLQRSLPPDEQEAEEHLVQCDSIKSHETADTPLLAAFIHVCRKQAAEKQAAFQYRISVPECFKDHTADLFYLLGMAKSAAFYWADTNSPSIIRFYLASGMGLWHFSLETKPGKAGDNTQAEGEQPDSSKNIEMAFSALSDTTDENALAAINMVTKDKHLKRILKKRKASLETETTNEGFRIDIMG